MYKNSYTANGAQTEFLFAFPFFQNGDINVFINDQFQNTGSYGVVPNETFSGGTVVFSEAPESGVRIDIVRKVMLNRVVDYQPTTPIDPEDLNTDFNQLIEAIHDIDSISTNLVQGANISEQTLKFLEYNLQVIKDKMSGGGIMGLYKNLISVLECAAPHFINDYGTLDNISTGNTDCDDYGVL